MQNNRVRVNRLIYGDALVVFAVLYPIIPAYFKIGVSFTYIMYAFILLAFLLICKKQLFVKRDIIYSCIGMWTVANVGMYIYHSYYMGAVWTILMIAALLVVSSSVSNRLTFQRMIISLCYANGVVCILGIVESLTGYNVWEILNNSGQTLYYNAPRFGMVRIISFTYQTISYCTYLVIVSALIFYAISFSANKLIKRRLRIVYILVCVNVILTLSRSAMLVFIVAQGMLLWGMGFKKFVRNVIKILLVAIVVLFVMLIVSPALFSKLQNLYYMLMAVFDNDYTNLISAEFGKDNLEAIGTRFLIYKWVSATVGDRWLTGVGYSTPFSYHYTGQSGIYTYEAVKKAIEVEYVHTYYESGFIGVVAEVTAFVGIIATTLRNKFMPAEWEGNIGFNYVTFVIVICLIVQYFSVNQSSEQNMFFLVVTLCISYNCHRKYSQ